MKSGVWNLGFGLVAIAAGASGQFAIPIPGMGNPMYLVGAGALVAALGVFQLWRNRGR